MMMDEDEDEDREDYENDDHDHDDDDDDGSHIMWPYSMIQYLHFWILTSH